MCIQAILRTKFFFYLKESRILWLELSFWAWEYLGCFISHKGKGDLPNLAMCDQSLNFYTRFNSQIVMKLFSDELTTLLTSK